MDGDQDGQEIKKAGAMDRRAPSLPWFPNMVLSRAGERDPQVNFRRELQSESGTVDEEPGDWVRKSR
jgi:hypothetical protein